MSKNYEKPTISIDAGLAEGVYAASGTGSVSVADAGVWDAWDGGGKHGFTVSWTGIDGTIVLTLNFNDTIDEVAVEGSNVQHSISGSTVTLTFSSTETNPLYVGCHLNHKTSIYDLKVTGYAHSVR